MEQEVEGTMREISAVEVELAELERRGVEGEARKELMKRQKELVGKQLELMRGRNELMTGRKAVEDKLRELNQEKHKLLKRLRSQTRARARISTQALTSLRLHREMGALRTFSSPWRTEAAPAAEGTSSNHEPIVSESPGETAGDGSSS
ncbi:hypothetical protein SpCBS45565_g02971 [Spizellomyces sp. 'palustris']|nr:hypothetical protein SpCBS45565_g02971 [Spizellomyces sp. 'palustris']